MERLSEIRFTSDAERLSGVRCQVRSVIQNLGFSPDDIDYIVLAVNEACMNVIQHAYGDNNQGDVILEILHDDDMVQFQLTDFAAQVDKSSMQPRDINEVRPGGLGLYLMREIMDDVDFRNDPEGIGNVLVMKKRKLTQ